MTRRLLLLGLLAASACNAGDQGAVSMRWRIVDRDTGVGYDPRDTGIAGGACGFSAVDARNGCTGTSAWTVHKIRLFVNDPVSGASRDVPDKYTVFDCRVREATTSFNIPIGTHALSLCAFDPETPGTCGDGNTPPPAIRQVKKSEITNLDVIEIVVHAELLGPPCADAGADGGPDGGTNPM